MEPPIFLPCGLMLLMATLSSRHLRNHKKIKNLERDPRISCLLEDGLVYEELRGIQINGTAERLYSDPETVHFTLEVL